MMFFTLFAAANALRDQTFTDDVADGHARVERGIRDLER